MKSLSRIPKDWANDLYKGDRVETIGQRESRDNRKADRDWELREIENKEREGERS